VPELPAFEAALAAIYFAFPPGRYMPELQALVVPPFGRPFSNWGLLVPKLFDLLLMDFWAHRIPGPSWRFTFAAPAGCLFPKALQLRLLTGGQEIFFRRSKHLYTFPRDFFLRKALCGWIGWSFVFTSTAILLYLKPISFGGPVLEAVYAMSEVRGCDSKKC